MGDGTRFSREISGPRACSWLSDSGEDAKVKGTRKVGGREKGKKKGVHTFSIQLSRSLEFRLLSRRST